MVVESKKHGITSMVILTYNQLPYTIQCRAIIRKYTEPETYEVIIVDNHATDGTQEGVKQKDDIRYIFKTKNEGFTKGCNQGMAIAVGEQILLLNNDVIVAPNWLENLLTCLYSEEQIGAVGPVSNNIDPIQWVHTDRKSVV